MFYWDISDIHTLIFKYIKNKTKIWLYTFLFVP